MFGYDDAKGTYTRRISKKYDTSLLDDPRVINLLLISNGETNHYCWIKNMSKLLSSKINNNQHKRHFCLRCLNSFNSKCSLIKHLEYCSNHEAVKIEMPKDKNKCIYFKNFGRKMGEPFVVYADFECYNEKMESGRKLDPEKSYNEKYQKHTPSGFGYLIKCFDNKLYSPKLVQHTAKSPDNDVAQVIVDSLEDDVKEIYQKVQANRGKYPKKNAWNRAAYEKGTHCHICEGVLGEDKMWDHFHFTGKYRGAAHNECNLAFKIPKFILIILHNLSGYDAHLFIKNLGKSKGKIDCIPNSEEKYISFKKEIVVDTFINKEGETKNGKRELRFIDSLNLRYLFLIS